MKENKIQNITGRISRMIASKVESAIKETGIPADHMSLLGEYGMSLCVRDTVGFSKEYYLHDLVNEEIPLVTIHIEEIVELETDLLFYPYQLPGPQKKERR